MDDDVGRVIIKSVMNKLMKEKGDMEQKVLEIEVHLDLVSNDHTIWIGLREQKKSES